MSFPMGLSVSEGMGRAGDWMLSLRLKMSVMCPVSCILAVLSYPYLFRVKY